MEQRVIDDDKERGAASQGTLIRPRDAAFLSTIGEATAPGYPVLLCALLKPWNWDDFDLDRVHLDTVRRNWDEIVYI